MDRYQYVEKLITERDRLSAESSRLSEEIRKAKARTKEVVMAFGDSSPNFEYLNAVGGVSCQGSWVEATPETEKVSDDAIKSLHAEIIGLEKTVAAKKKDLADLRSRDFVAHLKSLLS